MKAMGSAGATPKTSKWRHASMPLRPQSVSREAHDTAGEAARAPLI